jgi:hypothetical protein
MVIDQLTEGTAEGSRWVTDYQHGADLGDFAGIGISLAEVPQLV